MTVTPSPTINPADVIFVVERTALNGAYLNELKSTYILPTLEYFNGGPIELNKDCGSDSNYVLYGLVVFNSGDILPGNLTDVYGPLSTPKKVLDTLEKIQFSGGHGEAASHVAEGLATALTCLQDLSTIRGNTNGETAKHVILVCNCKPVGMPVIENEGPEGVYFGLNADQIAAYMGEKNVCLSIMSPRKIPALISLFDKSGGDSASQKEYARDPRYLVLLNGFALQERPVTPPSAVKVEGPPTPQPAPLPTMSQSNALPPMPTLPTSMAAVTTAPPSSAAQTAPTMNTAPPPFKIETPSFRGPRPPMVPRPTIPHPISVTSSIPGPTSTSSMMNPSHSQVSAASMMQQDHMSHNMQQPTSQSMSTVTSMLNAPQQGQQMTNTMSQMNTSTTTMGMSNPNMPQMTASVSQTGQMPGSGGPGMNTQPSSISQMSAMNPNNSQSPMNIGMHSMNTMVRGQAQQSQINNQNQSIAQMISQPGLNNPMNQQQQQQQPRMINPTSQSNVRLNLLLNQPTTNQMTPGNPRWQNRMPQQQQPNIMMQQQQHQNQGPTPAGMMHNTNQQNQSSPLLAQLQQPPAMTGNPTQQPTQAGQPPQGLVNQLNNPPRERQTIWTGTLEWHEKLKGPPEGQKVPRQVPCQVSASVVNGEPEVKGDGWPTKLIMQLIPKGIVGSLGGGYFRDVKTVVFMLQPCEELLSLTKVMDSGFAGCVHFTGNLPNCTIKVLILLYSKDKQTYLGFIPNDQAGFVDRIRRVIQQQKSQQATMRQFPGMNMPNQPGGIQNPMQGGNMPSGMVQNNMQQAGMQPNMSQGHMSNLPGQQGGPPQSMQPGGAMQAGPGGMPPNHPQAGMSQGLQQGNLPQNMQGAMNPGMQQGNIPPNMQAGNMPPGMQQGGMQMGNMPQGMGHSNLAGHQTGMQNTMPGVQGGNIQQSMAVKMGAQAMAQNRMQQSLAQQNALQQQQQNALFQQQQQQQQAQQQAQQQQQQAQQQQQQAQQQQQQAQQQAQQAQQQAQQAAQDDPMEAERQRNSMRIAELQQALQAAQAKELQFQQLHHVPGIGNMGSGPSNPQQQGINPQQINQPRLGMQQMMRHGGPQGNNPGLKNLLQQQAPGGPNFNRMMQMGNPRMQGQPGMQQATNQISSDDTFLELLK